jgi:hypothetical protein
MAQKYSISTFVLLLPIDSREAVGTVRLIAELYCMSVSLQLTVFDNLKVKSDIN